MFTNQCVMLHIKGNHRDERKRSNSFLWKESLLAAEEKAGPTLTLGRPQELSAVSLLHRQSAQKSSDF